jgi:cellular nucleic acid-binding protein
MSTNIYVLKLEGGRYYVGKAENVARRYQQHFAGNGSSWTKKYRPMTIVKTVANVSPFQEDMVTKEYMSKYGIDNVRGGSYCQIQLDESQIESLSREIRGASDLCTRCGRSGHYVKDCYAKTEIISGSGDSCELEEEDYDEEELVYGCDYCDRTFTTVFGCSVHEKSCKSKSGHRTAAGGNAKDECYRCGRTGHYSPECYATRHVSGKTLH